MGYPIFDAKRRIYAINGMSKEEKSKYVDESKWDIHNYHKSNNAFYSNLLRDNSVQDWSSLPVLTKVEFNHSQLNTISKVYKKNNLYKGKTSGSTGKPFHFYKDKFTHAMAWGSIWNAYSKIGLNVTDQQARFYAIYADKKGYYVERLKDWISYRDRFIINDLSEQVLDQYLLKFYEKRFKWVYGYSNSILDFCEYLDKRNIILKDICPTLNCCILTAEMCDENSEQFIAKQLGVQVFNEYGNSEFGIVGIKIKDEGWRIQDDHLFVEILNDNDEPVDTGDPGRIVITDLYNKAMPMIRYDTGDIGSISADGLYLTTLLGRENDLLITPKGRRIPGFTFYYIIKDIIRDFPDIEEYKIVQENPDLLKFYFVKMGNDTVGLSDLVNKLSERYLKERFTVQVEMTDKIEQTDSGKRKHFVGYKEITED